MKGESYGITLRETEKALDGIWLWTFYVSLKSTHSPAFRCAGSLPAQLPHLFASLANLGSLFLFPFLTFIHTVWGM